MAQSSARGRSGRPRDPALAERAIAATLELYAERGWSGLTVDGVAARARVGKAALYLRWPTKEALLLDALSSTAPTIDPDPALGLRELLLDVGAQMHLQYTGRYGPAAVRAAIEATQLPAALAPLQEQYARELRTGTAAVQRALDRGELSLPCSAATLIEVLGGALLMRALFTASMDEAGQARDGEAYVAEVVGLLLDGRLAEAAASASG